MYKLREPQTITKNEIAKHAKAGARKILVSAPTGFGKTILAHDITKGAIEKSKRVLFTAHRITLAEQTFEKFEDLNPQFLQGKNKLDGDYQCLVATLQTLLNEEIPSPDIIIIDEAHYAYESALIQSLFKKFPKALVIALSATPVDNRDYLLEGFDAIVDNYQTKDLIELGWLTPFRVYTPMSIDTSRARLNKTKGDFIEKELEEIINIPIINDSIVENYEKLGESRKFICFAVNKIHCEELKEAFSLSMIDTEIITANTSKKKRDKILLDFKNGRLKGLISIEILTAGFDEPTIGCVIMATATKQWKKYVQCCGRGIRLLGQSMEESTANGKPDCILLDCCGNVEEHGMPDDRKIFRFGKKISRVLDRELKIEFDNDARLDIKETLSEEKQIYLKKIGSLLDLYEGKVYKLESDLQEDVNKYLKKTGYFWWRQNSGKAFMKGKWVHFASKNGLPDNTAFYKCTSIFLGIELKLPSGRLTDHQKITLPEMIAQGIVVFICESIYDLYKAIEHVEHHVTISGDGVFISNGIHEMPERQMELRRRLKLI
tara:strand:- start:1795 stop:3435 length:1641 start_codon:yes stop_codon:yes gene_type:complete